jgi:hypothetical protein
MSGAKLVTVQLSSKAFYIFTRMACSFVAPHHQDQIRSDESNLEEK